MLSASTLAGASSAAFVGYLGILVGLHVRHSGYSPITHAVSDYAVGKTRRWATAMSVLNGIGAFALATSFSLGFAAFPFKPAAVVMLVALGIVRFAIIFFPTDLEGEKRTPTGIVHYILAIANFGLAYTFINNVTPQLAKLGEWPPAGPVLTFLSAVATITLIALVVTLILKPLRKVFGICERSFMVTVGVWFVIFSAFLAMLNV